jgi:hypothetical protein
MLRLCPAADEPWFWALAELVPSPDAARRIAPERVRKLLRKYRIRRVSAEEVLAQLRTQPVKVAPGTAEAARAHIGYLLPRLHLVASQMKSNEKRQEELLDQIGKPPESSDAEDQAPGQEPEHRDVDIILSVPGIGINTTATMLAEAPTAITDRDHSTLRTQSGVAPVTRRSNKRKVILRRLAWHPRLSDAMYHAARVHAQCDPSARQHYAA